VNLGGSPPWLAVLGCQQRAEKEVGETGLVGGGLADAETCPSCKFPLVSVCLKF
jgi:hypothetical protein